MNRRSTVGYVATTAVVVALLAPTASAVPEAVPSAAPGASRQAVIDEFYDRFVVNDLVPVGWTGSVAGCQPGAPSPAAQAATLDQVNYFRSFYGLAPVVFDPELSAKAQEAALIMQANSALSHYPPTSWACWTAAGAEGASRSNIALGSTAAESMWRYVLDQGANNVAVGHRRWLLNPHVTTMGAGSSRLVRSAHGTTYRLKAADRGKRIRATVRFSGPGMQALVVRTPRSRTVR